MALINCLNLVRNSSNDSIKIQPVEIDRINIAFIITSVLTTNVTCVTKLVFIPRNHLTKDKMIHIAM